MQEAEVRPPLLTLAFALRISLRIGLRIGLRIARRLVPALPTDVKDAQHDDQTEVLQRVVHEAPPTDRVNAIAKHRSGRVDGDLHRGGFGGRLPPLVARRAWAPNVKRQRELRTEPRKAPELHAPFETNRRRAVLHALGEQRTPQRLARNVEVVRRDATPRDLLAARRAGAAAAAAARGERWTPERHRRPGVVENKMARRPRRGVRDCVFDAERAARPRTLLHREAVPLRALVKRAVALEDNAAVASLRECDRRCEPRDAAADNRDLLRCDRRRDARHKRRGAHRGCLLCRVPRALDFGDQQAVLGEQRLKTGVQDCTLRVALDVYRDERASCARGARRRRDRLDARCAQRVATDVEDAEPGSTARRVGNERSYQRATYIRDRIIAEVQLLQSLRRRRKRRDFIENERNVVVGHVRLRERH